MQVFNCTNFAFLVFNLHYKIAELFEKDKSVISRHISNIFEEQELTVDSTVANFATVQIEGNRKVNRNKESTDISILSL